MKHIRHYAWLATRCGRAVRAMEEFPEDFLVPSQVVLGCLLCVNRFTFSCFPGVSGFTICFVLFLCFSQFNFPRFTLWIFSMTARHSHRRIMILIQFLHKPGAGSILIRCVAGATVESKDAPNLQFIVPLIFLLWYWYHDLSMIH